MNKKLVVIILSAIVFLSCAVLGISTVYRVEKVTVEASLVSEEAKAKSASLQQDLETFYERESIFFTDEKKADEVLQGYPYFRLVGFEKIYPNRILFKIIENAEVYAVMNATGDGYYILGEDGSMLDEREDTVNSLTGAENVLLENVQVTCQNGQIPQGDEHFLPMLDLARFLSRELGGIRSNVVKIEVFVESPETIYRVTMREGVKLYLGNPSERVEEKVKLAMNKYMALTYEEKLTGRIVVSERGEEIFASYAPKDEFDR